MPFWNEATAPGVCPKDAEPWIGSLTLASPSEATRSTCARLSLQTRDDAHQSITFSKTYSSSVPTWTPLRLPGRCLECCQATPLGYSVDIAATEWARSNYGSPVRGRPLFIEKGMTT